MKTTSMRESEYYDDYPKRPIGGSNPYYCCKHCGRSAPEINGRIDGHKAHCQYRQKMERDTLLAGKSAAKS